MISNAYENNKFHATVFFCECSKSSTYDHTPDTNDVGSRHDTP